jgi:hypothetical protein
MKRSEVIQILRTAVSKYNTGTPWYDEVRHAEEVLKILEERNLIKCTHQKEVTRMCMMGTLYVETITAEGWEDE